MNTKKNYSYIGIAFINLVFGIIFIPKIIDRISNGDIIRNESRSDFANDNASKLSDLSFIEINGVEKKVPNFSFKNQDGKTITNKDYEGKVYVELWKRGQFHWGRIYFTSFKNFPERNHRTSQET